MKKLARRVLAVLGSPWGIAVLAAVSTGSLLGIALGEGRWSFFLGVLSGALLTVFGMQRLRSDARRPPAPKGKGTPGRAKREVYDLESDRSTDTQRWPM